MTGLAVRWTFVISISILMQACTPRGLHEALLVLDAVMGPVAWPRDQWNAYQPHYRGDTDGPGISMETPKVVMQSGQPYIKTNTPAALKVIFKPKKAPVDPGSLKVVARKGLIGVDLTSYFRPYLRNDVLQVKGVSMPTGTYIIDVRISDTAGNKSEMTYHVEVT